MLLNGIAFQRKRATGVTNGEREDVCDASGAVDEHHWSTSEQRVAHRFQCAQSALHRNQTQIWFGVFCVTKDVELMANTTLCACERAKVWMLKRNIKQKEK